MSFLEGATIGTLSYSSLDDSTGFCGIFLTGFFWGTSSEDYSSEDTAGFGADFFPCVVGVCFAITFEPFLTGTWGSESSSSEDDSAFLFFRALFAFPFLSREAFLGAGLVGADLFSSTDTLDPFLGALAALALGWTGVS